MSREGMKKLIAEFGGQEKLADIMHVTQQEISRWNVRGYVPTNVAVSLCLIAKTPVESYVHPDIALLIQHTKETA